MIVLKENASTGPTVPLTAAQAAYLRGSKLVTIRGTGPYTIIPKVKQVGALHAHGLDVVVTPKVSIQRLLFLLGYAANPGFLPEHVEGVQADGLWPIVAETLCRHAERALAGGVLQGYTTDQTTSSVLRGRARVADQIARRPGRMMPLEITHDEYTVDIAENRLLRAAVRRMCGVPRVPQTLRTRLRHLDNRLDGASPLRAGAPRPRWRPHRLNARYHPALRIADLVLNTLSFEVGEDGLAIAAFVVNMERVFEDFVTTALREAWRADPGRTHSQYAATLDTGSAINLRIDVVHLVNDKPRFVVDAKYKLESRSGGYPNADIYQVLAYCTALQIDRAWLVYASGTGGSAPRAIRNTGITITEYPLDLDAAPLDLLAQVNQLARSAWI
ncbi:McrC family protein [Lentzea sp. NPDC060358]|uniref:McrC family protein n=1 Tax=Lentzea sp. NPDC060358 TaxID=3347103 RepID=UPI003650C161